MPETLNNAVEQCLAEALETMAFISPFPAEDASAPAGTLLLTRIAFRGAQNGAIELVSSTDLGALLAANLLGCDPSEPDAQERAQDALRELTNITCGAFLRRETGSGTLVEMGVPTQSPFDEVKWDALIGEGVTVFDAEGSKIVVRHVDAA